MTTCASAIPNAAFFEFGKARATPLHTQIADLLRVWIADESTRGGAQLDSIARLATRLQCSKESVARAYQSLADEGLIHVAQGRRTVVVGAGRGRTAA
ncbi:winged helix-turn-helix transcriptional regulator [Microbacteriaceae bacterium VKM Ac-2855]|nr:winged helix-turn-helix transcriptional regulator [Microbacteriaceae bacterium VKM Ac-2855]